MRRRRRKVKALFDAVKILLPNPLTATSNISKSLKVKGASRMRACRNRLALLLCGLVVTSPTVLAQRYGSKPVEVAPAPLSKDAPHPADYDGFTRKVALQATPEQVAQFQRLQASTQAARNNAQELMRYTAASDHPDMYHHAHPLTYAVDEALDDNERFLLSF